MVAFETLIVIINEIAMEGRQFGKGNITNNKLQTVDKIPRILVGQFQIQSILSV
jgi:hypothetical protein